jgi:hypothetical protein
MSYRDIAELSFVASNRDGGSEQLPPFWYTEIDGKRLLKLLIGIGLNGSGKTKIIQGLNYLRNIAVIRHSDPTDKPHYHPFLLDDESRSKPTKMWLSYYIDNVNYQYYVSVSNERIEEEELKKNVGRGQRVYYRNHNIETNTVKIDFGSACDLAKSFQRELEMNTLSNSTVLSQFGAMNLNSVELKNNFEYFANRVSRVRKSDQSLADKLQTGDKDRDQKMKRILTMLLQDVGSNIVDYHVESTSINISDLKSEVPDFMIDTLKKQYPSGVIESKSLLFEHSTSKNNKPLDVSLESLGTINIIRLLVVIYDIIIGKKSTCIDELGEGIHSTALHFILKMYLTIANCCQILVVTHDLSLLSPKILKLRRDAIRKFDKSDDGVTTVCKYQYVHNTVNLRNNYMEGLENKLPLFNLTEERFLQYIEALE